jgi:hypothetical protein
VQDTASFIVIAEISPAAMSVRELGATSGFVASDIKSLPAAWHSPRTRTRCRNRPLLVQEDQVLSTLRFCRSADDGKIAPDWDDSRDGELLGQFEVGLTVANRYLLKQRLGEGSMGRVFLALDLRLDRPVALKVVSHRRRGIANLEAALEREARLGANLNHKNIAAVYDFGVFGGVAMSHSMRRCKSSVTLRRRSTLLTRTASFIAT